MNIHLLVIFTAYLNLVELSHFNSDRADCRVNLLIQNSSLYYVHVQEHTHVGEIHNCHSVCKFLYKLYARFINHLLTTP